MQKNSRNVKWHVSTTASFDPPFGFYGEIYQNENAYSSVFTVKVWPTWFPRHTQKRSQLYLTFHPVNKIIMFYEHTLGHDHYSLNGQEQ